MNNETQIYVLGEVLYDCFPDGKKILGGAPFNVAWHLQAFGQQPKFISRVGNDDLGTDILHAMNDWGMDTQRIQIDNDHPTGQVNVTLVDDEPQYVIAPDCAYDFIAADAIADLKPNSILYHGTLALRSAETRNAYEKIVQDKQLKVFLDVNLRSPWWKKQEVLEWLKRANWVKLNSDELIQLGENSGDLQRDMVLLQEKYGLELLVLTQGEAGALVRTAEGEIHRVVPKKVQKFQDTVGAGDAFTAVFLHGLMLNWAIPDIITAAQQFASSVVGLQGATTNDHKFYKASGLV